MESIISRASSWAALLRGTWTAIWSPSKSALKAKQTSGWIWMAEPSTSLGMKAWMPRRCSVGARLRSTGWSWMTSSRTSQTSSWTRSTMRLADLMLWAKPFSTSWRMTNGLKSSRAIFLGRPHWCSLRSGTDHDDRAARVVDALAQQVLAEAALLALEHVREALEAVVAGAGDGAAAAAVVDQRVAGFLEHALLVADDDLRGAQLQQPLEAVVAVDDAAVEVVEVGGGEAAAVELDHGAQVRRDDRQHREDHPLGTRAGATEGLDEAQPLDGLLAAHAGARANLRVELAGESLEVEAHDALAHGLRAHAGPEEPLAALDAAAVLAVEVAEVPAVQRGLRQEVTGLQAGDLVLGAADLLLEALGVHA